MPTSRATRVTSSANDRSWSTIVLIVSFSSRISPLTSTVIFWLRSPLATAVVTWAMLRTWSVRFEAMKFTESVRSFQVPATPGTCAWPPSLPSVPTSRATRVTSSAKLESWSTIEFTVVPMRANSPLTGRPSISSAIFWFRSPSATATITRATSVVGRTRSSIRPLTESTAVLHPPVAPCSRARSVMRPSRPMISATRTSSASSAALRAAIWLKADSSRPMSSLRRAGRRTLKSPAAAACMACSSRARPGSSTCARPFLAVVAAPFVLLRAEPFVLLRAEFAFTGPDCPATPAFAMPAPPCSQLAPASCPLLGGATGRR